MSTENNAQIDAQSQTAQAQPDPPAPPATPPPPPSQAPEKDASAPSGDGDMVKRMAALEDRIASYEAERETIRRTQAAVTKGIPADKLDFYVRLAGTHVKDSVDFAAALDKALAEAPLKPPGVPGSGANPPPSGTASPPLTGRVTI